VAKLIATISLLKEKTMVDGLGPRKTLTGTTKSSSCMTENLFCGTVKRMNEKQTYKGLHLSKAILMI
jgi:hypothetical protein